MSTNSTNNYALAVCFVTLMCGAITTGLLLFNLVNLAAPELTIHPSLTQSYVSREAYRNASRHRTMMLNSAISLGDGTRVLQPDSRSDTLNVGKELTDEEIESLRIKLLEEVYTRHEYRAVQGVILQVIVLLICSILFLVHWKLHKRYSLGSNA